MPVDRIQNISTTYKSIGFWLCLLVQPPGAHDQSPTLLQTFSVTWSTCNFPSVSRLGIFLFLFPAFLPCLLTPLHHCLHPGQGEVFLQVCGDRFVCFPPLDFRLLSIRHHVSCSVSRAGHDFFKILSWSRFCCVVFSFCCYLHNRF